MKDEKRGTELEDIEAWIDAGGTFTDCYLTSKTEAGTAARRSCKILSSGVVPVSADSSEGATLHCPELAHDVDRFWIGAQVVAFSEQGERIASRSVKGFTAQPQHGELTLDESISPSDPITRIEIHTDLHAPVLGIRRLLGRPLTEAMPSMRVRLGTTRGTNALLTRSGARVAFAITAPFEDLLSIGDQTREDLFALDIPNREPLTTEVVGIRERLDARGKVLQPLDLTDARQQLQKCFDQGCDSLAICLMHSYVNATHEQSLAELAREIGFRHISVSSDLVSLIELVARAQTTTLDAYLSPIIRSYLSDIRSQLNGAGVKSVEAPSCDSELLVMTSAGGLVPWDHYSGKDSILSGPAGGICALEALRTSLQPLGVTELIGIDMGGTSTDVSRVAEQPSLEYESRKAGIRILTPTLPIETVASGGGSICWFDGVSLRVGPQSAGARPGPACYGQGGPLTVTDLNVFLERIPQAQFPFPLQVDAIVTRLDQLLEETRSSLKFESRHALARGLRQLANEQMAEAVRSVTITQGSDPRHHTFVGFGGAAGQHICEIAELLGVQRIVDAAEAGKLSALGMGLAGRRADAVIPLYQSLGQLNTQDIKQAAQAKITSMRAEFDSAGEVALWFELRYQGSDATLRCPLQDLNLGLQPEEIRTQFSELHSQRFGYRRDGAEIEVVSLRIEVLVPSSHSLTEMHRVEQADSVSSTQSPSELHSEPTEPSKPSEPFKASWDAIPRDRLAPGQSLNGPLIVANRGSTLVVEKNWRLEVLSEGTLLLEQLAKSEVPQDSTPAETAKHPFDPVFRDCFAARLSAIASQMGIVLQQTAVSVNVKQRRDFSCAVFDSNGNLLANAPHVPVHLGAMGQTVQAVLAEYPQMQPGESFITNDPYCGGSHLPDVTLVTPVFEAIAGTKPQLRMLVASRAHHADVGGISPGSMSIEATRLGQEGVILPVMQVSAADELNEEMLLDVFARAAFPPRNPQQNIADIRAQLAANVRGRELLQEYAQREGWRKLSNYADHLLNAAEQHVKNFLTQFDRGASLNFSDQLDDGTQIQVQIARRQQKLQIDFAGSGATSRSNFNANPSIVRAAVLYVLRVLIRNDLPLNDGVLRAIELLIPEGILDPPKQAHPQDRPAVAAGNVETSQRIVDVLLGAFQRVAASQGTMNNLLFGNSEFGFYETICGGAGATPTNDGASAVHTHMTNTRLTDPEVLEAHYPVRLKQFQLRRGSGGAGRNRGGEGVIREIEFLQPVAVSLLTSRRTTQPYGIHGGAPGEAGKNLLLRISDSTNTYEVLDSCCSFEASPGDQLRLETPGGGGFGTD